MDGLTSEAFRFSGSRSPLIRTAFYAPLMARLLHVRDPDMLAHYADCCICHCYTHPAA